MQSLAVVEVPPVVLPVDVDAAVVVTHGSVVVVVAAVVVLPAVVVDSIVLKISFKWLCIKKHLLLI